MKITDFEYRYALPPEMAMYEKRGWEFIAYAGHGVGPAPVLFIRRRLRW